MRAKRSNTGWDRETERPNWTSVCRTSARERIPDKSGDKGAMRPILRKMRAARTLKNPLKNLQQPRGDRHATQSRFAAADQVPGIDLGNTHQHCTFYIDTEGGDQFTELRE